VATVTYPDLTRPVPGAPDESDDAVVLLFEVLLMIISLLLMLLVLLHKGKGGGLSDMFGGGISSSFGGSSAAERNLDRITVGLGVVWSALIIGLNLLLKST
jgi:preprotein translocase subunit SecG